MKLIIFCTFRSTAMKPSIDTLHLTRTPTKYMVMKTRTNYLVLKRITKTKRISNKSANLKKRERSAPITVLTEQNLTKKSSRIK